MKKGIPYIVYVPDLDSVEIVTWLNKEGFIYEFYTELPEDLGPWARL